MSAGRSIFGARWLAVAAALGGCLREPAEPPASAAPSRLPAIPLVTLTGQPADLASVTHGHAALVSFWATWCEACEREFPALNRLSSRGVVVGVAVGESPATVGAFARSHALYYLQLTDPDFRLTDALGQRHVPATLVLDRDARIVYRGSALDGRALDAFRAALSTP